MLTRFKTYKIYVILHLLKDIVITIFVLGAKDIVIPFVLYSLASIFPKDYNNIVLSIIYWGAY